MERCPCRERYRDCLSLRRADPLRQPHRLHRARHRPTAATGERSAGDLLLQSGFARSCQPSHVAPSAGPAAGNGPSDAAPHAGRTPCDLANVALTQRPRFTLDPFAAAQRIAKVS
ncbi:hypothetical protein J4732_15910 [Serratia marcescens]|uniref:Uncharacterized protein n=1 Tax=Serratia marcescens TaxID=615 RepID=A0A939NMH5_SERMA|nr:hypothetical protein [Serratia marcescens]